MLSTAMQAKELRMATVKVTLIKPLDGMATGTEAEFDEHDAKRLVEMGAVKMAAAPANKMVKTPANKAKG